MEKQANDRLSRCASAIYGLRRAEGEAMTELDLFHAPSECAGIVGRALQRREGEILVQHGYTAETYNAALAEQCDGRQVYMLNLEATEGQGQQ